MVLGHGHPRMEKKTQPFNNGSKQNIVVIILLINIKSIQSKYTKNFLYRCAMNKSEVNRGCDINKEKVKHGKFGLEYEERLQKWFKIVV